VIPFSQIVSHDPYKGKDYVALIISQFDGGLSRQPIPEMPYMNGISAAQMAEVLKSKDHLDRELADTYRGWINSVFFVEIDNINSLKWILHALGKAIKEGRHGEEDLIRKFLKEEWDVGRAEYDEYLQSQNNLRWLRKKANPNPGPSAAWRDPVGVGRE